MREIIFRGKNKDNNFVYGDLLVIEDECSIITLSRIDWKKIQLDKIKVDPDTVGQYTGLTDKNGTKIFEGDLVYFYDPNHDDEDGVMEVIFDNCEFAISGTGIYVPLSEIYSNQIEVIGNKFDNPEMIKENEKDE